MVRDEIFQRLVDDLMGPHETEEVLEGRPSDTYLTGILWPLWTTLGEAEDDAHDVVADGDAEVEEPSLVGQSRPSTMGLSFLLEGGGRPKVKISLEFGLYDSVDSEDSAGWARIPTKVEYELEIASQSARRIIVHTDEKRGLVVELYVRSQLAGNAWAITITAMNSSKFEGNSDRESRTEAATMFQASLAVVPVGDSQIVPRPSNLETGDADLQTAALLYRDVCDYGAGHNCSLSWKKDELGLVTVKSEWLPSVIVPAVDERGHAVFSKLIESGRVSAEYLGRASRGEVVAALRELVGAYERWVGAQSEELEGLPRSLRAVAESHVANCGAAINRMNSSLTALIEDPELFQSFQLANSVMSKQHDWKQTGSPLTWRPFQLGYVLLSLESTCIPESPDRETLDLLWFPTGGGKTEAYLTLFATAAWYRRLKKAHSPAIAGGNVAMMRYTLRLLTAQQFERASAVILACELLRRAEAAFSPLPEFTIGLWVGGEATPNKFDDLGGKVSGDQILHCFACKLPLRWSLNSSRTTYRPVCENDGCDLGPSFGRWGVLTIDQDLYAHPPTLVIGTVDKFAQLPFNKEIGNLFGFGTPVATDLIIQDELHLISGPLGTISGVYEIALDWLLRKDGHRPKIVASTATIRRAEEQVLALFDRKSAQFPPPGLSAGDSGFAVTDFEKPGRLYVGVTSVGRSAKFTSQAVAASLLQSGAPELKLDAGTRDPYSTLLMYFNSLRELGGAVVQVLDDVPDSIRSLAAIRHEVERAFRREPAELTSRVSQEEILKILEELQLKWDNPDGLDAVLATNMVSVGVDVPRLGLMQVQGQPKSRAEYIQATSRVGRQAPGLVVSIMNAAKARDRSAFEGFVNWHSALYKDVEATSVTPFAARSLDKSLHAALVSMVRHSNVRMADSPTFGLIPQAQLAAIVQEIERRVQGVDPAQRPEVAELLDGLLDFWQAKNPREYKRKDRLEQSLMQDAETYARSVARGELPSDAWPTMNSMRNVETGTPFTMTERLGILGTGATAIRGWRQTND